MPGAQVPVTRQGGESKPVSKHGYTIAIPLIGSLLSFGFAMATPVPCGDRLAGWLFLGSGLATLIFYLWLLFSLSRLVFSALLPAVGGALAGNFTMGVGAWAIWLIGRGGEDFVAGAAFWIPCWPLALLVVRIADTCPD